MFQIRLATAGDIAVIARHRARMFEELGTLPSHLAPALMEATTRYLERALPAGEYAGWLAAPRDDPATIAAGAGLQRRTVLPFPHADDDGPCVGDGREAIVINVYTELAFRRRGIARLLMQELIGWSRRSAIERIALHASPDGRGLYESLGFTVTNEMRLQLASP